MSKGKNYINIVFGTVIYNNIRVYTTLKRILCLCCRFGTVFSMAKRQAGKSASAAKRPRRNPPTTPAEINTSSPPVNPELVAAITAAVIGQLEQRGVIPLTAPDTSMAPAPVSTQDGPDTASKDTQAAAASEAVSIIGEPVASHAAAKQQVYDSNTVVNSKIKSQIWANEYVDLGALLHKSDPTKQWFLSVEQGTDQPKLLMQQSSSKPKIITSFEEWMAAFQLFMAVHAERDVSHIPAMLKYAQLVRELNTNFGLKPALYYDESFRQSRQLSSADWGKMDCDLWVKASTLPIAHSSKVFRAPENGGVRTPKSGEIIPKGFCYRFHETECKLQSCAYKHDCYKCGGKHPARQCQPDNNALGGSKAPEPNTRDDTREGRGQSRSSSRRGHRN